MVSALDSRSNSPGLSASQVILLYFFFLSNTHSLNFLSASLRPGVQMGVGELLARQPDKKLGGKPVMDYHPIQGH